MNETPLEAVAEIGLLLAVILVAAKLGGEVAVRWLKLPPVLGELSAGILIGPFALGGFTIGSFGPLFEVPKVTEVVDGVMRTVESSVPVEPELFFLAQAAAVLLLFQAGLETNRQRFFRYVRPAAAVALGGVLVPFAFGVVATVVAGFASFESTQELLPALFIGAVLTATSVGITARVLADVRRLDTPEGVTVMAAAVVDDVLGILILAVVIGVADEGGISGMDIFVVALKAIGFWLGLTLLGSLAAPYISRGVLWFQNAGADLAIALALAFFAAAVAEIFFGLAMIIGSYTIGLALSDTELKRRIEEPMLWVNHFVVPVFFVVIGMQVDPGGVVGGALGFGLVLAALAIFSKLIGAGLPALLVGFNRRGSWRIACGMLPRGEVALTIAGIGLASGVIDRELFGVAILMVVATLPVAPPLLMRAFTSGGSGLRRPEVGSAEAGAPTD